MKRLLLILLIAFAVSCKHDYVPVVPESGFPEEVGNILVTKCAVDGCHNALSRSACGGLDFSTWDLMFEGGRNGTSVIPYSTDYSYVMYSLNTDTLRGPVLLPTMPYLSSPLSETEFQTIKNWIANGAPNKDGIIKWSDNPNRRKIYICMQGCDNVAVIDAETKIIMRYIPVGAIPNVTEQPHLVRVSPDGNFWYVVFYFGQVMQKFRTSDDALVATLTLDAQNFYDWNTIIMTPDGRTGFVNATLANITKVVNLESMTVKTQISTVNPHGGFVTNDGHYLYLTCQVGNFIQKIDLFSDSVFYGDVNNIVLAPGQQILNSSSLDPHEAICSPDNSKYFVSCQKTNEVRVFQTSNDSLLDIIPVGTKPQEFDVSTTHPYVFVTCTEDVITANQRGSVYVINYNDLSIVGVPIITGYQPHGLAVDDEEDIVYVANLNYDANAPAPHHVTVCGDQSGNLTIIRMNSLDLYYKTLSDGNVFQFKTELLEFPYFVTIRK